MRKLPRILLILAALAFAGAAATFPIASSIRSKAKLIQVVQKQKDDVFGDSALKIGSPQSAIVDDESVFVSKEPIDGAYQVDDALMKAKGIRPLQAQTVDFLAGLIRLGLGGFCVVAGLAGFFLGKKAKPSA